MNKVNIQDKRSGKGKTNEIKEENQIHEVSTSW